MSQAERDQRFQEFLRSDPEMVDAFSQLVLLSLITEQRTGLARRRLRTQWMHALCPPDERQMKHRVRKSQ